MSYLSRHCYDKPHRCPGWAGGGWKYPKVGQERCDGGYIAIDREDRWYKWRFHRCPKCPVICLPIIVQELDLTWWAWRLRCWKNRVEERVLWTIQPIIVVGLVNLCGLLDKIPAYRRSPEHPHPRRWTTSQWGCWPLRLAHMSDKLDQRWNTGVWEPVPEGEEQGNEHVVY